MSEPLRSLYYEINHFANENHWNDTKKKHELYDIANLP